MTKKNILICPLDWGLGHATRCIPIIRKFIDAETNVIIAADKRPLALLKKEFPSLQFINFPGYNITYPDKGLMAVKMFFSIPRIIRGIRKEHKQLKKIISDYQIDLVISDNRFGLWNKKTKCVFMTHQIVVKCPPGLKRFESILFKINKHFIKKYDECWIPDIPGMRLSGTLTKNYQLFKNIYFIGLLSRFEIMQHTYQNTKIEYDVLCVISGPEPQRTIFEKIIFEQLKQNKTLKAFVIRGVTETNASVEIDGNISMVDHLDAENFLQKVLQSSLVLCRPGYSSLMDMVILGKNAVFVPTPGQTEQEYLGKHCEHKSMFYSTTQDTFNLKKAVSASVYYSGMKMRNNSETLDERINILLK